MTPPKPLSPWQQGLPESLPRHFRRNIAEGPNGCWLWTRSVSPDGYGWASLDNRTHQAHRLSYRLVVGEPAEGAVLDHLCRVRRCVNPAHLEPVTPAENLLRSDLTPSGMTKCAEGHELTWTGQQRRCLECKRDWRRQYARDYRRGIRRRAA